MLIQTRFILENIDFPLRITVKRSDAQCCVPYINRKDNQVSFQYVTGIGLKTTQFFSFQKISTNTVARGVQNFG